MVSVENNILKVEIAEKGAELLSIKLKKDGTEYLWTADSTYWNRHAPVLFPIVGRLKDNHYTYDGKTYELNQHGFARDNVFGVAEGGSNAVELEFGYNEETLKRYPFKFKLKIRYELDGNKINVRYTVINEDDKEMFFSIGGHPGFNCPLMVGEKMEDYYLEFEQKEVLHTYDFKDGVLCQELYDFKNPESKIELSKDVFKHDALIIENIKSKTIALKSHKNSKSVTVELAGFPFVGLWSKLEGAPFVCIEPWYGVSDNENCSGNIENKKGINKLAPAESFSCSYSIVIK
ncbi:aldose 1-epimerase family protein [Clostridium oryzae]|uniref:Aldose 1-epimerase n=1 Tax=Clostridium oryzae TaxID=1450648 RepID=A0A1V4IUK7_9CLOT|nr:aldose 1-epimerase family protein [Clostridium oryzae]OPJ63738.1 aldose 1-epimerase [Clostridium oryzae]